MTKAANWDTRSEVQKQHIRFREQFYEVKFNIFQKAYAHFRMMFANKDTIIGANCTLADHCDKFGTVTKFKEAIGDTEFTNPKRKIVEPLRDIKTLAVWAIRIPFLFVAIVGAIMVGVGQLIVDGMQKICVMLPGTIE